MPKALVWLRNDLRVADNRLLQHVVGFDLAVPVYIVDSRLLEIHQLGFQRADHFRMAFLLESLQDLRANLQAIGSDLEVLVGNPVELIPTLASRYRVSHVVTSFTAGHEEQQDTHKVAELLNQEKFEVKVIDQDTLFPMDTLPWPIAKLPETFTVFRKQVERLTPDLPRTSSPLLPPFKSGTEIPSLRDLGYETPKPDSRSAFPFRGGESAAWGRIQTYFWERDRLSVYKETRNGLLGTDYSSKLSAWLALGCISARSVVAEIKRYEQERVANESTYWLYFELLWREFFQLIGRKHGRRIFFRSGIQQRSKTWRQDQRDFERWCLGETGDPFVDANMRELNLTGFMSNRGRQNVASFLVQQGIDWTWGASYFESKLIDYDVCNNWCNWGYLAGVGNDPRGDRAFNTTLQQQRYDPNGDFLRCWGL